MIPLAILLTAVVLAICLSWLHHQRPLAERLVEVLYWLAYRALASAQAADHGLLVYRERMAQQRAAHRPEYQWAEGTR